MNILSRGVRTTIVSGNSSTQTFVFNAPYPIITGELILHNLGTTTPIVVAKDLNNNVVTGITVEPVYNNLYYEAQNLSYLITPQPFVGTITLSK